MRNAFSEQANTDSEAAHGVIVALKGSHPDLAYVVTPPEVIMLPGGDVHSLSNAAQELAAMRKPVACVASPHLGRLAIDCRTLEGEEAEEHAQFAVRSWRFVANALRDHLGEDFAHLLVAIQGPVDLVVIRAEVIATMFRDYQFRWQFALAYDEGNPPGASATMLVDPVRVELQLTHDTPLLDPRPPDIH